MISVRLVSVSFIGCIDRYHRSALSIGFVDCFHRYMFKRSISSVDLVDQSHRYRFHRLVSLIGYIDRSHRSIPSIGFVEIGFIDIGFNDLSHPFSLSLTSLIDIVFIDVGLTGRLHLWVALIGRSDRLLPSVSSRISFSDNGFIDRLH